MDPLDNNHKQRRWLTVAIVLVVAVLVGLFFFRRGKGSDGDQYRSEVIDRGDVTSTVSATGTVSAVITVQVGSQVSGIISKLYADFNSQVKKGQILAELDPTPFEQQVEQQQANVVKSKVDVANTLVTYNRQKRLFDAQLIAQSDLDAAKAAYDGAKATLSLSNASLKQAQTNLSYTKIYSPIEGQVVARQYDLGQTVAASFSAPTLFTIAQDLTKMQVQADVDQSDIGQIKVGELAHFNVDAYPDQEFRGEISQVRLNATITQNVITYPVIIAVPNPDGKLRPSMTANVTIDVATVKDVLRVPNSALRFKPEGKPDANAKTASSRGDNTARGGDNAARGGGDNTARGGDNTAGGAAGAPGAGSGPGGGGHRHRGGAGAPGAGAAAGSPAGQVAGGGPGTPGSDGTGTPGGGPGGFGGKGKGGHRQGQTVYVLGDKNALRAVYIRTGISDGHYTQVVGGELKPGDKVVTGVATLKVQGPANPGSGRPPGMGRF
jgi:HlyD family secretion protein